MKQISVFVENKVGRARDIVSALSDSGINLTALSMADTTDYGIMRLITSDPEKSQTVLKDRGYVVQATDVIAVAMNDVPGALADVLRVLAENEIFLSYFYAYSSSQDGKAVLVFKVDHPHTAQKVLTEHGIKVFN